MQVEKRFEALDSFRGIAALMVAFYHFMVMDIRQPDSANVGIVLIENLWLFTDFFFVLSGFVLSYRYYSRKTPFFSLLKARFFRLFPLQIFTTVVFCGFIFCAGVSNKELIGSFLVNITNLQIFFPALPTLNTPSWSISAEFYFSVALGALFLFCPRGIFIFSALIVAVSSLGLSFLTDTLSVTYGIGWIRALLGMALGCAVWPLYQKFLIYKFSYRQATFIEAALLLLFFLGLYFYPLVWFLLPVFLCAGIVFVFAREEGAVSSFMKQAYFLKIGALSYSIYLNHFMILIMIQVVFLGFGVTHEMLMNGWVLILPLVLTGYFTILMSCAAWTYKNVECYWQKKKGAAVTVTGGVTP